MTHMNQTETQASFFAEFCDTEGTITDVWRENDNGDLVLSCRVPTENTPSVTRKMKQSRKEYIRFK